MNTDHGNSDGKWVLPGIVLVGFLLRVYRLGYKSLWLDEAELWATVIRNVNEIHTGLTGTVHPPLFLYIMHFVTSILGESEFVLRSVSLVAGASLVPVMYSLARMTGGVKLARLVAVLTATSPFLIMVSQEARMYSLLGLLGGIQLFVCMKLINKPGNLYSALYIMLSLCAVYTHHLGWILVIAENIFVVFFYRYRIIRFQKWLLIHVILVAGYLPLLNQTLQQIFMRQRINELIGTPSPVMIVKKIAGTIFYFGSGFFFSALSAENLKALTSDPVRLGLFLLMLLIPAVLMLKGALIVARTQKPVFYLLGLVCVTTVLFGAVEGSPANHMVIGFIPYIIFLGYAFTGKNPRSNIMISGVLALLWLVSLNHYYNLDCYPLHKENWRTATRYLELNCSSDDKIYVHSGRSGYLIMNYYYKGTCPVLGNIPVHMVHEPKTDTNINLNFVDDVQTLMMTCNHVWFVFNDWHFPVVRKGVQTLVDKYLVTEFEASTDLHVYQLQYRKPE